jgi:transcriptional regulator with XRE-family HTH domain
VAQNNLKKLRMKIGLTQMQLAAKAKTSQQQIQRIEAGQAVRLELATAICSALKVPLEKVFPGTKAPAKGSRRSARDEQAETESRLARAGIGTDDFSHDLLITFRSGMQRLYKLTDLEAEQAEGLLTDTRNHSLGPEWMRFVIVETETHTAVINKDEVAHVASGWDVVDDAPDVPKEVNVYLLGSAKPLKLWTAPDPERPEDLETDSREYYEEYMEEAPIQHALSLLDGEVERADFMQVRDEDGCVHSVKYGCIALIEVPWEYQGYVEDTDPETEELELVASEPEADSSAPETPRDLPPKV